MLLWVAAGVATLSFLVWVYLVWFRGFFWRLDPLIALGPVDISAFPEWPSVGVVIPARNEAPLLAHTLPTVLWQRYPGPLHVFLADDHSEDGTSLVARRIAEEMGTDRLTVLGIGPLPEGWTGKLWAMQQGVQAASRAGAEYIYLTDADVAHSPDAVVNLVAKARREDLDAVSLMPTLPMKSAWEKLLMPAFVYFFVKIYPFRWVNDPRKRTAAAVGMSVLLRRAALEQAGGIAAICDRLIDDCSIGKLVKERGRPGGGTVWVGFTDGLRGLRSHARLKSVWDMVARTAYVQLNHSPVNLAATALGMLIAYVAPLACAVAGVVVVTADAGPAAVWLLVVGVAAWALMIASYLPSLRWANVSSGWAHLLPVTALLYTLMTIDSALRFRRGKGGEWKGRTYAARR